MHWNNELLNALASISESTATTADAIAEISASNSTTALLGSSATYTGTWESCLNVVALSVRARSDVPGTLYVDFSRDGSEVSAQNQASNGISGDMGYHDFVPKLPYFRVRVVNGSQAQGEFYVVTIKRKAAAIALPTSRAAQTVGDYSDVLNVRVLTDPILDEVDGRQADRSPQTKFGYNPDVGTSPEAIWSAGGLYTGFLTAASTVRIKAGGNVNDTAAGSGAQKIVVAGLDENWEETSEEIVTAGASASSSTTTTFIRVYRAYVTNCGTYGANNASAITIETTGGTVLAEIPAGEGQTMMAVYTVPAGYTAYMRYFEATVETTKSATVRMWQRQNADDVSTPYTAPRLVSRWGGLGSTHSRPYYVYRGPFPAKTDLYVTGFASTGTVAISAEFDLILIRAT